MPKETVYRLKEVEPADYRPSSPDYGRTEKVAPVPQSPPANQPSQAKLPEAGEALLNFHPDHLVQGFVFAEILGRPRCRRSR
ncbi:MAG TPA: hypothetical protein VEC37_15795 [Bacillota bacterium]|nr:hypothetical protein [Bacillota bacterium]